MRLLQLNARALLTNTFKLPDAVPQLGFDHVVSGVDPITKCALDVKCKQFLALFLLGHNYMCASTAAQLIKLYSLFQNEEQRYSKYTQRSMCYVKLILIS